VSGKIKDGLTPVPLVCNLEIAVFTMDGLSMAAMVTMQELIASLLLPSMAVVKDNLNWLPQCHTLHLPCVNKCICYAKGCINLASQV
jgi:hypothetical protein